MARSRCYDCRKEYEYRLEYGEECIYKFWDNKNHDYLEQTIKPITRIGVLATGCRVQKWDGIFDKLEKSHDRKTVAIDMEGHAMNRIDAINDLTTIVVKGVGDFATSNKTFDNRFMEYACFALYSFLENFLTDETTKHLFD